MHLTKLQNRDLVAVDKINSKINVKVKYYGAFRKFGDDIEFSVPKESSIADIKAVIQDKLNAKSLVQSSVISNEDSILQDDYILNDDATLSILPPVCGG